MGLPGVTVVLLWTHHSDLTYMLRTCGERPRLKKQEAARINALYGSNPSPINFAVAGHPILQYESTSDPGVCSGDLPTERNYNWGVTEGVQRIFHLLNYTSPDEAFFQLDEVGASQPRSIRVLSCASRYRAATKTITAWVACKNKLGTLNEHAPGAWLAAKMRTHSGSCRLRLTRR